MRMYWHIVNQVSRELKLVQSEIHYNFVGGVIVEKIILSPRDNYNNKSQAFDILSASESE